MHSRLVQYVLSAKYHYCSTKYKYHYCSDHALLQSLLVLAAPPRPRPCCAPALYSGLDLLHLDPRDETKLAVTHWRSVRVTRCACA